MKQILNRETFKRKFVKAYQKQNIRIIKSVIYRGNDMLNKRTKISANTGTGTNIPWLVMIAWSATNA